MHEQHRYANVRGERARRELLGFRAVAAHQQRAQALRHVRLQLHHGDEGVEQVAEVAHQADQHRGPDRRHGPGAEPARRGQRAEGVRHDARAPARALRPWSRSRHGRRSDRRGARWSGRAPVHRRRSRESHSRRSAPISSAKRPLCEIQPCTISTVAPLPGHSYACTPPYGVCRRCCRAVAWKASSSAPGRWASGVSSMFAATRAASAGLIHVSTRNSHRRRARSRGETPGRLRSAVIGGPGPLRRRARSRDSRCRGGSARRRCGSHRPAHRPGAARRRRARPIPPRTARARRW